MQHTANAYEGEKAWATCAGVHELVQVDEWRNSHNGKGGSVVSAPERVQVPTSSKKPMVSRVYLCNKIKHKVDGKELSCYDIWHTKWANGSNIPSSKDKNRIRARTPGAAAVEEHVQQVWVQAAMT
ncbi:hypothetical protein GQ600_17436 [Phytophthora cactorum]|nr:hypothetical protein GQ600_17436 [Phytophthora cactorum]